MLAVDPAYEIRDNQLWYGRCRFAHLIRDRPAITVRIEGLGERTLRHSEVGRDGRPTRSFKFPSPHDRHWWEARRGERVRIELLAVHGSASALPDSEGPAATPRQARTAPRVPRRVAATSLAEPEVTIAPVTRRGGASSTLFDAYVFCDWSASSSPKVGRDSIWIADGSFDSSGTLDLRKCEVENPPTRAAAEKALAERLLAHVEAGRRVLVGLDFPFGYPAGSIPQLFPGAGDAAWRRLWKELERRIRDSPSNDNNRFQVAAELNRQAGELRFWGCPDGRDSDFLRRTKESRGAVPEYRKVEVDLGSTGRRPFAVWQLYGNGSVGSQALVGLPVCECLRARRDLAVTVWPFETGLAAPQRSGRPSCLLVEIWPGAIDVDDRLHLIRDAAQMLSMVQWAAERDAAGELAEFLEVPSLKGEERRRVETVEGWILGFLG